MVRVVESSSEIVSRLIAFRRRRNENPGTIASVLTVYIYDKYEMYARRAQLLKVVAIVIAVCIVSFDVYIHDDIFRREKFKSKTNNNYKSLPKLIFSR